MHMQTKLPGFIFYLQLVSCYKIAIDYDYNSPQTSMSMDTQITNKPNIFDIGDGFQKSFMRGGGSRTTTFFNQGPFLTNPFINFISFIFGLQLH